MMAVRSQRGRWRAAGVGSLVALSASLLLAACSSSPSHHSSSHHASTAPPPPSGKPKGTVTFAEFPNSIPNYILPVADPEHAGSPNVDEFSNLMWPPLYWQGNGNAPTIDPQLSLAYPPKWSGGGKVVTVRLKPYKWSDGKPVTSRDVEFMWNLIKANKTDWYGYVPGNIPDNVTSFKVVSPSTFQLTLNKAYSQLWFDDNELPYIVPLPQHVWDKTSVSGKVGNYDMTTAGAKAVYKFLEDQAKTVSTYDTNPLWKVVDGPWKLTSFTSNGQITFRANTAFAGSPKPHIETFKELPFTTASAEFSALLSGQVDYGYVPFTGLKQKSRVTSLGFHLDDWYVWGGGGSPLNYNNATDGPIFKQLYFRQALAMLVNQPQIIKSVFDGQGVPTYGPIPLIPPNPYVSIKKNLFPYNPKKAVSLLKSHGWAVHPGGTTVCARPGTGPTDCGAGIPKGRPIIMKAIINNGNQPVDLEYQSLKSTWSQIAGIHLNLDLELFTTVVTQALTPCKPGQRACFWQTMQFGGDGYGPDGPYPTGSLSFASGGTSNVGFYSNKKDDQLIAATHVQGVSALHAWEHYLARQVPQIWLPNIAYQVSAIKNNLHGANGQNPSTAISPNTWYYTSGG